MKRSGIADLPLHGGRVPAWLATRMTTLGTAIAESVTIAGVPQRRIGLVDCAVLNRFIMPCPGYVSALASRRVKSLRLSGT